MVIEKLNKSLLVAYLKFAWPKCNNLFQGWKLEPTPLKRTPFLWNYMITQWIIAKLLLKSRKTIQLKRSTRFCQLTQSYFQFQDKQLFRLTELITYDIELIGVIDKKSSNSLMFVIRNLMYIISCEITQMPIVRLFHASNSAK